MRRSAAASGPWGLGAHVGVGGLLGHEDAADLSELLIDLAFGLLLRDLVKITTVQIYNK